MTNYSTCKSLILCNAHIRHRISAISLSGELVIASRAWCQTIPHWSLDIHATPPCRCWFLQLAWISHLIWMFYGGDHLLVKPISFVSLPSLFWALLISFQAFTSSKAIWTKLLIDSWVLAYSKAFLFFQIIQKIHGITLLFSSVMDSSDIICILKLTFFARGRALKLWSEEKPASVQTSWAIKQWKRTCLIVSGALLHKLHVKGTFVPLVFNLSATANAPAATLHRNKWILGSVGIFQTLRFNSRVAWSCTMEFLTFCEASQYPLFTVYAPFFV